MKSLVVQTAGKDTLTVSLFIGKPYKYFALVNKAQ
jgi:hypothetical protein